MPMDRAAQDGTDGTPVARGPFLLDAMLGKLATYLRMCGHDAAYVLDREVEADGVILAISREEDRTLITRDEQLAARADGLLLRSREVEGQLGELIDQGVELRLPDDPVRCGHCNACLDRVDAEETTPEHTPDSDEIGVWECQQCGHHFWKGSHWDRVSETAHDLQCSDADTDRSSPSTGNDS